jgi:hypothetical protein
VLPRAVSAWRSVLERAPDALFARTIDTVDVS